MGLPRKSYEKDGTEVPDGWNVPRHAPNALIAVLDTYTGMNRSPVKHSLAPLPDLHRPKDNSIDHHSIPPGWDVPRHSTHMMDNFIMINGILRRDVPTFNE